MYLANLSLYFGHLGWLYRETKPHITVHTPDNSCQTSIQSDLYVSEDHLRVT